MRELAEMGRAMIAESPITKTCRQCGQPFRTRAVPQTYCNDCVNARTMTEQDMLAQRYLTLKAVLAHAGLVSDELLSMTLSNYQDELQRQGAKAVREWLQGYPHSGNLALLGPVDTGKTHLGVGVMRALMDRGKSARYAHWPTTWAKVDAAEDRQTAESAMLDTLFNVDLLVIDDAGRESVTPHKAQWLDVLLDSRWANRQTTIITANLDPVALVEYLGAASESRFHSCSVTVVLDDVGGVRDRFGPRKPVLGTVGRDLCQACQGAGWVVSERVAVGNPERAIPCSRCNGRGW